MAKRSDDLLSQVMIDDMLSEQFKPPEPKSPSDQKFFDVKVAKTTWKELGKRIRPEPEYEENQELKVAQLCDKFDRAMKF